MNSKVFQNMSHNQYPHRSSNGQNKKSELERTKKTEQEPNGLIIELYEDFLPAGVKTKEYSQRFQVITVVGTEKFSILRIFLKKNLNTIALGDNVNLDEMKDNFQHVKKLRSTDWTLTLKDEIIDAIEKIVKLEEVKFVDFFNHAHLITNRLHQLKILPTIGEKRVVQILKIRDQQEFLSYEDIEERIGLNPIEMVTKRVMEELEEEQKYVLFTKNVQK